MNPNNQYIIKLSKAAIFNEEPQIPETILNWEYIYAKSVEQNIAGLLFTAVNKLPNQYKPDKNILLKWHNDMVSTIGVMNNIYNEFMHINNLMQKEAFPFIGLKGCVLRNLYPVPELRTMGDFDILTPVKTIEYVKNIFVENNYIIEKDVTGIVCKYNNVYWEIFTTTEEEFRINTQKWDTLFFSNTTYESGILTLNNTYFLIHLIMHTGKHYIGAGAGIRNLCDIALFINFYKNDIDFNRVKEACEEQGYLNIYGYIINSVQKWFGVDISEVYIEKRDCDRFIEYTLLNGVFGKDKNTMVPQISKFEDENIRGIRKILFPSVRILEFRYKYLRRYPFLLPVAWIHRIFSAVYVRKYSFKQMLFDMKEAIDYSDIRTEWLSELDLFDKRGES